MVHAKQFKVDRPGFLNSFKRERAKTIESKLGQKELSSLTLKLKKIMWDKVGILRSAEGLVQAIQEIDDISSKLKFTPRNEAEIELANMVLVSRLIAQAALDRTESRGAHYRTDYPKQDDVNWKRHLVYKMSTRVDP